MSSWKDKRMDGQVVIVTGANTGIGKATALELATRGAKVILACRSLDRGNAAADEIRATGDVDANNVTVMQLDLVDFQSVRNFVAEFNSKESRLDVLVNNAAAMFNKRIQTPEGNEMTFQVNHLGVFLLTNLLLEKLKASTPSRVVNVSSEAYQFHKIDFQDLSLEKNYKPFNAYAQSKLANIYFTQELDKRIQGSGVTTYALHPGIIKTELGRDFGNSCLMKCFRCLSVGCTKSPASGAATTIYCSTADDIPSGEYYSDCKRTNLKSIGRNTSAAEELWKVSETLVGL